MALPVPVTIATGFADLVGSSYRRSTDQLYAADAGSGNIIAVTAHTHIKTVLGTGYNAPSDVELSVDGGSTWNEAHLLGQSKPNAWRLWEYNWRTPRGGSVTLIARATDSRGHTQPVERDWNRGTYMINHLLPITVEIRI